MNHGAALGAKTEAVTQCLAGMIDHPGRDPACALRQLARGPAKIAALIIGGDILIGIAAFNAAFNARGFAQLCAILRTDGHNGVSTGKFRA